MHANTATGLYQSAVTFAETGLGFTVAKLEWEKQHAEKCRERHDEREGESLFIRQFQVCMIIVPPESNIQ